MWDFTLNNYSGAWSLVVQVLLLLVFLLFGNVLRRAIPFLRKAYIPSALLGGLLLLVCNILLKNVFHVNIPGFGYEGIIDQNVMQTITYHSLAIGFIAMTLKINKREDKKDGTGVRSIQNGLLTGATYMLQAVFGIFTILIFVWAGKTYFYDTGVLLPLSFGQGPGNALTWDMNFSNPEYMAELGVTENYLTSGGSLGLSLASIGFIVASIVGVIYINIHRRTGSLVKETVIEKRKLNEFIDKNEIQDSESVDKLSIQVAFVGLAYALTFGIMSLLSLNKFTNMIAWGFNFIFGVISAIIVKIILNLLTKKNVVHRRYINNYQMDRISGFSFDIMIIAGVAAIEINDIQNYIVPIIVLSIVGTIVTYLYVRIITRLCFKGYEHEMFLVNFGTLTGTASNGMILLREVDPSFETPASNIFTISQFPAMIAVAPLLLLLKFSATSIVKTYIALGIFFALFIAYTVLIIVFARRSKSKKVN